MAVTRAKKEEQLKELTDKWQKSQSVLFAHYIGMTVSDVSELRNQLRQKKAEMKVAKKTLMRLAAKELKLPEIGDDMMDGAVACIFSYEDPLSGGQITFKFAKDHPQVELIGGVFEGKLLSKEEAVRLAKIPGKQQLLGMFAAMCNGPLSSFARALSELAKQKEAPAAEAPKAEAPKEEAATPAAEEAPAAPAADAPPAAPSAEAPAKADA
jgi:large subunit ribosomal protein L10